MDKDKQQIKIAEVCGYTDVRVEKMEDGDFDSRSVSTWEEIRGTKKGKRERIPDYVNSLDAMYKAEKYILDRGDDWGVYCDHIMDIFLKAGGYQNAELVIHASVAVRAKAFLKTFDLWEE